MARNRSFLLLSYPFRPLKLSFFTLLTLNLPNPAFSNPCQMQLYLLTPGFILYIITVHNYRQYARNNQVQGKQKDMFQEQGSGLIFGGKQQEPTPLGEACSSPF